MELIVCTVTYNKAIYIEYQYECLKKYITVPFKYIVFDNSVGDDEMPRHCNYVGATYIRVPQHIHSLNDPSSRAGISLDYGLRYIYNDLGFRGIVMVNDSDLFLIKEYNPINKLGENDLSGLPQNMNGTFYTNQLLLMNFNTLPNFNDISFLPSSIDGINRDCGGLLVNYFNNNQGVRHTGIDLISSGFFSEHNIDTAPELFKDFLKEDMKTITSGDYANRAFSEIFDNAFIHLRAGSNWYGFSEDVVFKRDDNLFTFLCNKLIDWDITKDDKNKYIVSFSLYGNNPKYTYNAIINAIIGRKVYKGWICRYYIDHTVPENIVNILKSFDNTEIVKVESNKDAPTGDKMFWRFYPASEDTVAAMISRDCDSWLSFREAYSVKKWIKSDKNFHIIRDHCYHSQKIMGGMWGVKRGTVPNMSDLCQEFSRNNTYDQGFLAERIYPNILNSVMVHIGENQRMMGGAPSNGYFPDGGVPFETYAKIIEYIPTIDIERANDVNIFNCCHCGTVHTFFIGEMLNNFHSPTQQYLSKLGLF